MADSHSRGRCRWAIRRQPWLQLVIAGCMALGSVAVRATPARSAEQYVEFLHGLQELGMGEVAIEYLQSLQGKTDLPPELQEVLPLELGKSLLSAARNTQHKDKAEQWLAEARTNLDAFLKAHPDHAEAASAFDSLGTLESDHAKTLIGQARASKEPDQKKKLFTEARASLEAARPRFAEAVTRFAARLEAAATADATAGDAEGDDHGKSAAKPEKKLTKRQAEAHQRLEDDWLDARFKHALLDYYIAQTYFEAADDAARKAALTAAGANLDAIYQQYRTLAVGLYAHMWHGKTMDELGDLDTALDIYDEVLVNAPEQDSPSPTGLEPLFAQVEYFHLMVLVKKGIKEEFLAEAEVWLNQHKKSRETDGYQGISLELVKAMVAKAQTSPPEQAGKLQRGAMKMLADMSKVKSEHQQEAIVMRRLLSKDQGGPADVKTFDEAVALGDAAAQSGKGDEAIEFYHRALEIGAKDKKLDPERLVAVRLGIAKVLHAGNKLGEAVAMYEAIARENAKSKSAPMAAAMAINAALSIVAATDDPAALERLTKIADFTVQTWPNRAEADDARLALGQAKARTDLPGSIAVFEKVTPESERYPVANLLAGKGYWQLYLVEKGKPASARNAETMAANRAKAEEWLKKSQEGQRKKLEAGAPLPAQLVETELLLGEIALEGQQPDQAVALLQPLIDARGAASAESMDRLALRMFVAAVRSYVALKQIDKAKTVADALLKSGGDTPPVNGVLVEFAKMLDQERKGAEAEALAASRSADEAAKQSADTRLTEMRNLMIEVLKQLASRQHHAFANMMYIGDTCAKNGAPDEAEKVYNAIDTRAAAEPDWVPANVRVAAMTRIKAQRAGLLMAKGEFDKALVDVDALLKDNPNALELWLQKGRILQAKADKDAGGFDKAVGHWTQLRMKLERLRPKPPEYYEVMYNTAACLVAQSQASKDKTKAGQAVQLLNAALVLSPKLSGPDMVARYDQLKALAVDVQAGKTVDLAGVISIIPKANVQPTPAANQPATNQAAPAANQAPNGAAPATGAAPNTPAGESTPNGATAPNGGTAPNGATTPNGGTNPGGQ